MPAFCQTFLLAQCVIQRLFQRSFVKRSGIPNIIGGARQQCFTWVVGLVVNKTGGAVGETLDRKSTRLNSSHVKISYAVFCLKKKKQEPNRHMPPAASSL